MNASAWLLVITYIFTAWFIWRHVGINLSLTSVLLFLLLVLHGPMYLYYTRIWGPETIFYEVILSAAGADPVLPTMDVALTLTFIGVCLGVKLADLFSGSNGIDIRRAITAWPSKKFSFNSFNLLRYRYVVVGAIFFVLLPFAVYEHQIQKVIEYVMADISEVAKIALRREKGGSDVYLYNLLCAGFFPFLAFLGISTYKNERLRWKLLIGIFVLLLLLAKMATLSKAPPAIFLLQCALVLIMTHRLTLTRRTFLWISLLILGLFLLMVIIANPVLSSVGDMLDFLFYRVFMIPNESLFEYFSAIPFVIDFTWGREFGWLTMLLQESPKPATYWLVGEAHRGVMGSTTTAMFIGDAWADFSWIGVIVFPVTLGALVRLIDRQLIVKRRKTAVTVAALSLGHYGLFIAMNTALQTALLTGGLLLVLPLVAVFGLTTRSAIYSGYMQQCSTTRSNLVR